MSASHKHNASIALTLGLLGLVAWLLPIVGVPIGIVGLVLAIKNIEDSGKATAAVVLCVLCLVASGINAYIGAQRAYEAGQQLEEPLYSQ